MSWTPEQLRNCLMSNKDLRIEEAPKAAVAAPKMAVESSQVKKEASVSNKLTLKISGQIRGGKNNMGISRTGKHFPKKNWAVWRDEKVREIKCQLPENWTPVSSECCVCFLYTAGDKRRRDFPAIVDSVWHILEKAGVVADDTLLWVTQSKRNHDKTNPHSILELEW